MPQIINTNVASLNAQRNLNSSQSALNVSLQRLSSGLRINSAKDDAAGLAISERFTSQIRGLNQAARNASDGISLAQTAEGALGEVTNNLQRIRELAVQSANATNSASDRTALQQEVSQLVAEVDRVARQTNFNNVQLLDGSFTSQTFQVGANVGDTIDVAALLDATSDGLGLTGGTVSITTGSVTAAVTAGEVTVNGTDIAGANVGAVISNLNGITGVTATLDASTVSVDLSSFVTSAGGGAGDTFDLVVDGSSVLTGALDLSSAQDAADLEAAIDTGALGAGYTVTVASGTLTISKDDGTAIDVNEVIVDADTSLTAGGFNSGAAGTNDVADGAAATTFSVSSTVDLTIAGTDPSAAGFTAGTFSTGGNVNSVSEANTLITTVDAALTTINGSRATLGAIQNRFESVVNSLQTSSENLSAARSRIMDADFAAETAALTRAQILQQAGTAMLSQANSLPQNVLALLQ